ncbi:SGNH/GDSL hydrolase family protein [Aeromicrobium sp.]|uniref:SGNH/GDSL hydrolase family protein n=1 Tax=Aeromicrobium sp. TaxID=1871063 RepID=UPI002FC9BF3D
MARSSHKLVLSGMIGLLAILTACQGSDSSTSRTTPTGDPSTIRHYVAMGDSFTSGPGISPGQSDSDICLRSERNYPHLLAEQLAVSKFDDVSCAGASTTQVMQDVPADDLDVQSAKAQTAAINRQTDLVTIGIGFNNGLLASKLFNVCVTGPQVAAKPCRDFVDGTMPSMLPTQRGQVLATLRTIRAKAPRATIVLVGYLPLVPEPSTCSAPVLDPGKAEAVFDAERAIEDNLSDVAEEAGVGFVTMRRLAAGHGICDGADAWVNGRTVQRDGDGMVLHPRAAGMTAVAAAVREHLESSR